ncbi:MAG: 3-dehydroquinate synthase [Candidatus Micrarchaeota archaeon]
MKKIQLTTNTGSTQIAIGEDVSNLKDYLDASAQVVIISDKNVLNYHRVKLEEFGFQIIEIETGENVKTLRTVENIYEQFLELGVERSTFIVGVGGGVVCDITGFVASTYLRGLKFGFVPTTLLAQVDASIGGKNGVNLNGYKNLIGTIRQPNFVLCDLELLKTLPKEDLKCGFAEIVKHAVIADANLFSYLESNLEDIICMKRIALEKVIGDAISVKVNIVQKDELEQNERVKLNFGHTIAHALEKVHKLPHGEAVAIGSVYDAKLCVKKGTLKEEDKDRIENLLKKLGLPTQLDYIKKDAIIGAISKDKKKKGTDVKMALLEGIGKSVVKEVPIEEIGEIL